MATKVCPRCSHPLEPDARFCAYCGELLTGSPPVAPAVPPRTRENKLVKWLAIGISPFVVALLAIWTLNAAASTSPKGAPAEPTDPVPPSQRACTVRDGPTRFMALLIPGGASASGQPSLADQNALNAECTTLVNRGFLHLSNVVNLDGYQTVCVRDNSHFTISVFAPNDTQSYQASLRYCAEAAAAGDMVHWGPPPGAPSPTCVMGGPSPPGCPNPR